mmetsp:Transcript_79632/g.245661  ORF Transcript_79632/g.245661 Transcript_79632/m.245661 type:complete len:289 (+) Transcript_79632:3-869(+)
MLGCLVYAVSWLNDKNIVVNIPGRGQSLLATNLYALTNSPLLSFVYSQVCLGGGRKELRSPVLGCIVTQVLYEVSVLGVPWFPLPTLNCLLASCAACLATLIGFFTQPLAPQWTGAGGIIARMSLAVGGLQPCVALVRYGNLIGNWSEQVLLRSLSDVLAMTGILLLITLSCILSSIADYRGAMSMKSNRLAQMESRMKWKLVKHSLGNKLPNLQKVRPLTKTFVQATLTVQEEEEETVDTMLTDMPSAQRKLHLHKAILHQQRRIARRAIDAHFKTVPEEPTENEGE